MSKILVHVIRAEGALSCASDAMTRAIGLLRGIEEDSGAANVLGRIGNLQSEINTELARLQRYEDRLLKGRKESRKNN